MDAVLEQFSLKNTVAVVTGALGKLGYTWVRTLLSAGAMVAAVDLPGAKASPEFEALLLGEGAERLNVFEADVTDKASLLACRDKIHDTFGLVSVLVNNAGIDQPPSGQAKMYTLPEIPIANVQRVFDVNVMGAFLCHQVFGEDMLKQGQGSIINIGSLYASVSPQERLYDHFQMDPPFLKPPAYGASKAALINLTRYFAAHWGKHGIRVNALSPGGVEGGQDDEFKRKFCERVPMARMAQLEDLAGPLLFLASPASQYVTGTELVVDGGFLAW